jgi:hypothetical protein
MQNRSTDSRRRDRGRESRCRIEAEIEAEIKRRDSRCRYRGSIEAETVGAEIEAGIVEAEKE